MYRITGSFFDIVHGNKFESAYWHDRVVALREDGWQQFMDHMAASGLDTLILIASVSRGRAVFPDHPFLATFDCWGDSDPLEAAMNAADKAGLKLLLGLGNQEKYSHEVVATPEGVERTVKLADKLYATYGHHACFAGWYLSEEFGFDVHGGFNQDPVKFTSDISAELKRMTPEITRMISPYFHTKCSVPNPDVLIPQLERMDVDIVSVQNGANHPDVTEEYFVNIAKAFEAVDAEFWGNVELFAWEDMTARYKSALVPGPFERIKEQISWIGPYADKLISYQFMGIMNNVGLGKQPAAAELWKEYMEEVTSRE